MSLTVPWYRGAVFLCGAVVGLTLSVAPLSQAQSADVNALQQQIHNSSSQIQQLEQEIAKLQRELNQVAKEKQTLQGAVRSLDLNIQSLTKSITLTNTQISQKDNEIRGLSGEILTTADLIQIAQASVAASMRQLDALGSQPLAIVLLGKGSLSDFFDNAITLSSVRTELRNEIDDLSELKGDLEVTKSSAEQKREELASLQRKLAQEKQSISIARAEQNTLLKDTQNKESTYQALIAEKERQRKEFEQALRDYEAQLNLAVNPGSFATPNAGVLRWPVEKPYITQYFGNTPFATANAQVYGGRGHNAIDLRATPGTPILAARGGKVRGTGNTDLTCPNASYGKWVFVDHDNGLSTLYTHLSVISVSDGQQVSAGQVLGYSGSTGYATGPHLHFGVFASAGAKITTFPSQSCRGKNYTMPVADPTAYLNPLSYLPAL